MSISRKFGFSARSSSLLAALCPLALLGLAYGCASAGDADPMPSFGDNRGPSGPAVNGAAGNGSATPTATNNSTPSNSNNTTNSNVQTGSSNNNDGQVSTNLPQTNGAAGNNAGTSNNSGTQGSAGTQGSGGTSGTNTQGSAGTNGMMAGNAGSAAMPPPTGAAGTSGTTTPPPPATPDIPCPAGAIFCSGFEGTTFPAGTANIIGGSQFADAFKLDTTQVHSGKQSFFLPLTSQAFSYRVMAIPVTAQQFWARMFVRFDTLFGDNGHDGLFAISTGDLTVDNNNETRIEFAEQEGSIVFNRSTDVVTFPSVRPQTLPPNTWHCLEARFDGDKGDLEVFANGQPVISSLGNATFRLSVKTFRIGTLQFHEPRTVWFDDVIISADRVGCTN